MTAEFMLPKGNYAMGPLDAYFIKAAKPWDSTDALYTRYRYM